MTKQEIKKILLENGLSNTESYRKAFELGRESNDTRLQDLKSNLFCFCQYRFTLLDLVDEVMKETEEELSKYVNEWIDSSHDQKIAALAAVKQELLVKYSKK